MKRRLLLILATLFVTQTSVLAENDHIFSDSLESTQVIEVYVDTVISNGESVSAGGVTVTGADDSPSSVEISNAVNRHMQPVVRIVVSGGNANFDLNGLLNPPSSSQMAGTTATTTNCPRLDKNFPLDRCEYALQSYFATEIDPWGQDKIEDVRIPNNSGIFKENYLGPDERKYELIVRNGSQLYASTCALWSVCDAEPVILVHGFQNDNEIFGAKIDVNGGPGYWGSFPQRLLADGYNPYEFKWLTNARFEDVAYDLAEAIKQIKVNTGKNVHIVAHSFGGILTRRMLQSSPLNQIASSIASVTTIGTPHNGIFWSEQNFSDSDVSFPDGQDSIIFKWCDQISCHLMGENVLGSTLANLLDVGVDKGAEAHFLATTLSSLPALKIQSLIGFMRDDRWAESITGGDGLISGEGQRFYPNLVFTADGDPEWEGPLFKKQLGNAEVTEWFLGRHSSDEGAPYLEPNGVPFPTDFVAFKHSPGTVKGNVLIYDEIESFVPPGEGFHDVYQRVLDWIGGPVIKLGDLVNEQVITGELSEPDEEDTFSFTANAGETVRINAIDINEGDFDPRLVLYGPDGTYIKTVDGGSVASLVHLATTSGTYTLVLTDTGYYYAGYSPAQYKLLFVRIPGANEGGELVNEGVVSDSLDLGDIDTYTFTANAGETVRINAIEVDYGAFDPRLVLYGPDGTYIKTVDGGSVASLLHLATTSGTYTVVLYDTGYQAFGYETVYYKLLFVRIPGANEGGELVNEGIIFDSLDLGDMDIYTFTANTGETVRINAIDINEGYFKPRLVLYGPDGTYIKTVDGGSVASLLHLATTSGIYTIVLYDIGYQAFGYETVHYELLFVRIPGANEGGELVNGGVISDSLDLGDIDTYTFTANVSETIRLNAIDVEEVTLDLLLTLYGSDGAFIKSVTGSSVASLVHLASASGTYTIMVRSSGYYSPPYVPMLYDLNFALEHSGL